MARGGTCQGGGIIRIRKSWQGVLPRCLVTNPIPESDFLTFAPSASMDFASDWYHAVPTEGVPGGSAGYWLEQHTPSPPQTGPGAGLVVACLLLSCGGLLGPHLGKEKEAGGWVEYLGR